MSDFFERLINRCCRELSTRRAKRTVSLRLDRPLVSFTFDDFPATALDPGGDILKRCGVRGTFFVSLGLMDLEIPAGRAFSRSDLLRAHSDGHELGCHTFAHCHAWDTDPVAFSESVRENEQALKRLIPDAGFKSHSYPIAWPRPATKRLVGHRFAACRGGGQETNRGTTDLNLLKSFFLEKCGDEPELLDQIIEDNRRRCGWLIFSTHDVAETPTRYGCTPNFLRMAVERSLASGARVLPVAEALTIAVRTETDE